VIEYWIDTNCTIVEETTTILRVTNKLSNRFLDTVSNWGRSVCFWRALFETKANKEAECARQSKSGCQKVERVWVPGRDWVLIWYSRSSFGLVYWLLTEKIESGKKESLRANWWWYRLGDPIVDWSIDPKGIVKEIVWIGRGPEEKSFSVNEWTI